MVIRFGEFADRKLESRFRESVRPEDVRELRRNLAFLTAILAGLALFDPAYLTWATGLGTMLPLRIAFLTVAVAVILLPDRAELYSRRHHGVLLVHLLILTQATASTLLIARPDTGLIIALTVMIQVITLHLFTPTRPINSVVLGPLISAYFIFIVMPLSGSVPQQQVTAFAIHTMANIFGGMSAIRLNSLRRQEFARTSELAGERSRLAHLHEELTRREEIIAEQRNALAARVGEVARSRQQLLETQASLVQAEKTVSLGRLVAGVAHEVNTPLGVAVTATSHLADSLRALNDGMSRAGLTRRAAQDLLTAMRDSLNLVQSNISRASVLVDSFHRTAAEPARRQTQRVPLRALTEQVVSGLMPALRASGHSVDVDIPDDTLLIDDPDSWAQILGNLINNAAHHAFEPGRPGLITISARSEGEETKVPMLALRFADNGRGIPAELLNRVFDPFFTTNRSHGGSGLGLNIVYNLVHETLGGTMILSSLPGEGTWFDIRVPLSPTNGDADTPQSTSEVRHVG
jgi:signal transduction histidine kinase